MQFKIIFLTLLSYGLKVFCTQNVKLSVYYETLCPDSVEFFAGQLKMTYEKIGPHLTLDLIPYGFASYKKSGGNWLFQCQHGKRECIGNKFHACALAQNNGHTAEVRPLIILCSMTSFDPASPVYLKNCAGKVGVDFTPIDECFGNGQGDEVLALYGDRTDAVIPKIKYIPTIVINDVYNETVQDKAEFDLLNTLCQYLKPRPNECF